MSTPPAEPSPAERYAAARRRAEVDRSELGQFRELLGFPLDEFQVDACQALERGSGVLVAAPTGAGKTVVGEFAVHLALGVGPQGVLHDAHQGPVQPEVLATWSAATAPTRSVCSRATPRSTATHPWS